MKSRLFCLLVAFSITLCPFASAADAPVAAPTAAPAAAAVPVATKELTALVDSIKIRLQKGTPNEADFAGDLSKFDQLLAEHQGDKSDAVAQILLGKAALYLQVFKDYDKAVVTLQQLAAQFPNTPSAGIAAKTLPDLEHVVAASAIQRTLVVGSQFPDFSVVDLEGKPLSIAAYKGKVVLIDFWATWCAPCMQEMPNVIAAYHKYHDRGFDIIGISLDHENQHDALVAFLKTNQMPWRQYYDGKFWQNDLALKYGVDAIPQSYLLDGTGKIIAIEPRGPALAPAIEAALAAK